jgi:hypothetical protein
MFIKYTPKYPHMKVIPLIPEKGKTFDNDTVTLRPGTNELKEEEWEAIQPHIKDLLGKEIVPFTIPVKEGAGGKVGKAKTLKDVPVATARKIIQSCQDPKTLKKWFNQELSDELLLVVSKRMRQLKVEPEDLKDDDAETLKDSDITPEGSTVKTDTKDDELENLEDDAGTDDEDTSTGDNTDSDEDDEQIPDFDGSRGEE